MTNVRSNVASFPTTFVQVLRQKYASIPRKVAFTFLHENDQGTSTVTYAELDREARRIAAWLQREHFENKRVLLVYPQGLEYITAFLGCLYAGAIAVPAYPPRMNRNFQRIKTVVRDCEPSVALTSKTLLPRIRAMSVQHPELVSLRWVATEEIDSGLAEAWEAPSIDQRNTAFLQYTSGSTSEPKGVIVAHSNLIANSMMIQQAFEVDSESIIAGWLPLYHDMGLIGNVLQTLWAGAGCVLFTPGMLLRRPLEWLRVISRYHATVSGGPNFAYDLCVRKATTLDCEGLDLSSWRVAFNGSEPIRSETMSEFSDKFGPYGFNPSSFLPCYGLAEATLFVTGRTTDEHPALNIDSNALSQGQIVPRTDRLQTQTLVSSGKPAPGVDVAIVNPETRDICDRGVVGEVWISGANVAYGYWNNPGTTTEVFQAFTAQDTGPYLRTGDLGCLFNDELLITGRIKDLIILRGRNYYPQDIEFVVSRCHPAFRGGAGAAFTVEVHGSSRLVFVQEVAAGTAGADLDGLMQRIVQTIAEEQELRVHVVALARPASLPKTSSGKIRRQECRRQFLAAEIDVLAQLNPNEAIELISDQVHSGNSGPCAPAIPETNDILLPLRGLVAELLEVPIRSIDVDAALTTYGLDSLQAAELSERVSTVWNIDLPLSAFIADASISSISALVSTTLLKSGSGQLQQLTSGLESKERQWPLSYGQRALLYLYKLAPNAASYHIPIAILIHGDLDVKVLEKALNDLVKRHDGLRTAVVNSPEGPIQQIRDHGPVSLPAERAEAWGEGRVREVLLHAADQPFHMEEGPLYRFVLLKRSRQQHILLLVFHHIITDFYTLTLFIGELKILYTSFRSRTEPALPPLRYEYAEFVRWQERVLRSETGAELKRYWEQALENKLPILKLPTDHPRPPVQSYRGATLNFGVEAATTFALSALASEEQTTVYTVLLTAFIVLLYRYSSQTDIVVGSPVSGRTLPRWQMLDGYLVNQIVIHANVSPQETFRELLTRVKRLVAGGLAHQDYPLAILAQHVAAERDPAYPPLFQAMFSFQNGGASSDKNIAAFAMAEPGYRLAFDELFIEPFGFTHNATELDLTLVMAELDEKLIASFRYNSDLFEEPTIARMGNHFRTLLDSILSSEEKKVCELRLLSTAEEAQLLQEWNSTTQTYPSDAPVHEIISREAVARGDAPAVIAAGEELSFSKLEERSNQLAHYLRSKQCGPGTIIAICIGRRPSLIIGLLGVLKSGAAYLPIDTEWPSHRIEQVLSDAGVWLVVTETMFADDIVRCGFSAVCLDHWETFGHESRLPPVPLTRSEDLAYVMYTSGSTGRPKGVMVPHRSLINFFHAMDDRIDCGPEDTFLAVTAASFDISVVELLWTLAHGARVILANPRLTSQATATARVVDFDYSLFYFASNDNDDNESDKYKLLIEGALFADKHGFKAVWTPERHFHPFGGLYPNPVVTSAALATITRRIQIRAGSVVLPLHNVIRLAEEWSVVDNLSDGRVGLAFASGWHADDFALAPHNYPNRKELMFENITRLQRLWRGESVEVTGGSGKEISIKIFPSPRQKNLPIWITAAGTAETFIRAGEIGAHILTHLLGQSVEELSTKIDLYRKALAANGHDPASRKVTLMVHTFMGEDVSVVKDIVREPFTRYLASAVDLIKNFARNSSLPINFETMTAKDMDDLLAYAFDRYFETSALFGTVTSCTAMIERFKAMGVNEVACLIDFGVPTNDALNSLQFIDALKNKLAAASDRSSPYTAADLARLYKPTMMQCTPSTLRMLTAEREGLSVLQSLNTLMIGGETLPSTLARDIKKSLSCRLVNMYGPTETTVWSSTAEVNEPGLIHIGTPIGNTTMYILARDSWDPVPIGVIGELHIGGQGLARGYLNHPSLTAERFVPDPFATTPGQRLYRTGDLARFLPNGTIQLLGRDDQQVKVRGVRIELGEIESALCEHPSIDRAVVVAKKSKVDSDMQLLAYAVIWKKDAPAVKDLRAFLRDRLPEGMIPSRFVFLDTLPLTTSGKIARDLLPEPEADVPVTTGATTLARGRELAISTIWKRILEIESFSLDDNFFDLGGHSLRLVQVHEELSRLYDRDIPLVKLLEHPTVRSLAAYLDSSTLADNDQKYAERAVSQKAAILRQQRKNGGLAVPATGL